MIHTRNVTYTVLEDLNYFVTLILCEETFVILMLACKGKVDQSTCHDRGLRVHDSVVLTSEMPLNEFG